MFWQLGAVLAYHGAILLSLSAKLDGARPAALFFGSALKMRGRYTGIPNKIQGRSQLARETCLSGINFGLV